ncbi:biotin--[acetyl-CoA-carboxylase] ligase [candidate division KSB1 bacterium]|nr:biotin--[acetyl-CoA-carboxylase] ligase [candidate division KSB1 bacterium]
MTDSGRKIIRLAKVSSTNDLVKEEARTGVEEELVVWADSQTHGRGRLNRRWSSRAGLGLYCSLLLRPQVGADFLPIFTLLTSLAAAQAIENLCGLEIQIKWPNDLVCHNKKLGGILTESSFQGNRLQYVVIGLGINVCQTHRDFPARIFSSATSIFLETHRSLDPGILLHEFLAIWDGWYSQNRLRIDPVDVVRQWQKRCSHLNRTVEISTSVKKIRGTFIGLTQQGFARLSVCGGEEIVVQGELSLKEVQNVAGH